MNSKKYILTGSVVLVLAIALFFILSNAKSTVVVENPASNTLQAVLSSSTPTIPSLAASSASISTTSSSSLSSTTTIATSTASTTYSVSYTSIGFAPNALTLRKGDSIVFTNNSSSSMWVASDPYPDNTNYPEFNQNKGTAVGSTFKFTFDRIGSFGFHDNLAPQFKGIIVVE